MERYWEETLEQKGNYKIFEDFDSLKTNIYTAKRANYRKQHRSTFEWTIKLKKKKKKGRNAKK